MRESRVVPPRHGNVQASLLAAIRAGSYKPDDRLPSEDDLARQFGASRATVREALAELARGGFIVRRHGSGTYVAPRSVIAHSRIDRFTTLTEVIAENGHRPHITQWQVASVLPPAEVAQALEIGRADHVWRVARTYLAGKLPAAYCVGYVPQRWHGRSVAAPIDPGELRWIVEAALGVSVTHLVTSVMAVPADVECAAALRVPEGTPLLLNASLNLTADGSPVLHGFNYSDSTLLRMNIVQVRPATSDGVQ
ncbi:MAG TPA: GntR family transcriptional regulator [Candidatus Binatia bacterium]|nr:GntR family transcriptional regulator [Candidatus Binatia bacterium]